jgi:hypothetical protein
MSEEHDQRREVRRQLAHAHEQEEHAWAEARRPPPASVRLPQLSGEGPVAPDAVGYPLIAFPWEPWRLTGWMELTQDQARACADWLNETEAARVPVILAALGDAGAPVAGLRERPDGLHRPDRRA